MLEKHALIFNESMALYLEALRVDLQMTRNVVTGVKNLKDDEYDDYYNIDRIVSNIDSILKNLRNLLSQYYEKNAILKTPNKKEFENMKFVTFDHLIQN